MTSKDPVFTEAVDDLNAAMAGAKDGRRSFEVAPLFCAHSVVPLH